MLAALSATWSPLKCLNQESRLALTEQCQEGTDVNWDVYLWQHNFCSFSVAGAAKGHGVLNFPTALCQPNASVSLISSAIASRICYCVKQALSPNPKMLTETLAFSSSIQLKKASRHSYPPKVACTIPSHLTLLFSITGAEKALFLCEVSSPAAGRVLLSFSGFSPAFQQPSKAHRSDPGTEAAQHQAPWRGSHAATARGCSVPPGHSMPIKPPHLSLPCVPR